MCESGLLQGFLEGFAVLESRRFFDCSSAAWRSERSNFAISSQACGIHAGRGIERLTRGLPRNVQEIATQRVSKNAAGDAYITAKLWPLMSGDVYKETGHPADKRRTQRVLLQIQILVRAQFEGDTALTEETNTLVVNADGALISLAMRVKPGQRLVLRNWSTAKEQDCRVVHVREKPIGKNEVGIAFPCPMPKFWGLAFPLPDWTRYLD